jgi:hypothetical protein
MEEWTPFILIKVGISGDDLFTSARECTALFRRNLVLGLVSSSLSRLILFSGNVVLATVSGLIVGGSASIAFQSPYGYFVGGVAAAIPFYILRFLGNILLSTMDATFICYLHDMDSNACHLSAAHRLFAQTLAL